LLPKFAAIRPRIVRCIKIVHGRMTQDPNNSLVSLSTVQDFEKGRRAATKAALEGAGIA
jgi:hypothetical protein